MVDRTDNPTGETEVEFTVRQATSIHWPNLNKDQRAVELAKTALGWAEMSTEQRMDNARRLAERAQQIKETL